MKTINILFISLAIVVTIIIVGIMSTIENDINKIAEASHKKESFVSNDKFIDGLYTDLDLTDSNEVFRYVFSHLDDEVTVYPTENYYYFAFPANGKTISGSLSLFTYNRDEGVLGFGYAEKVDKLRQPLFPLNGGGANYNATDGVFVKKIDDFTYSVTFEEKTVIFNLNDVGLDPPKKAKLLPSETFVGPSFDESGLKFFLIFNQDYNNLFWILNEDGFVPESFTKFTPNIVIGDRTEFAFYLDAENNRKILIGTAGLNTFQNNWYDGPFDQMPDNYVYTNQIEVKKYLEANYGLEGQIDKYGNYLYDNTRVAVAPYTVYFSKSDLGFVEFCKSLDIPKPEFYSCITTQTYDIPDDFLERIP